MDDVALANMSQLLARLTDQVTKMQGDVDELKRFAQKAQCPVCHGRVFYHQQRGAYCAGCVNGPQWKKE